MHRYTNMHKLAHASHTLYLQRQFACMILQLIESCMLCLKTTNWLLFVCLFFVCLFFPKNQTKLMNSIYHKKRKLAMSNIRIMKTTIDCCLFVCLFSFVCFSLKTNPNCCILSITKAIFTQWYTWSIFIEAWYNKL